jgi:predicted SAM-dependent methyltransferase
LKINIGSGYKRISGFVNVDSDPKTNPDYVVDLEVDTLPFENDSVSEVLAEHILEHIGNGFFHLLKELYRVCKEGASIHIEVPHYLHFTFNADPTHVRRITAEGLQLFSKQFNLSDIASGGHSSALALKYDVDFEITNRSFVVDDYYRDIVRNNSDSDNLKLSRELNNFFLLEIIDLKVVK